MRKYLVIKDGVIVDLLELEGYFNASTYEQEREFYDTVQEYIFGEYVIGQEYCSDLINKPTFAVTLENGTYKKHMRFLNDGELIGQEVSIVDSTYNVVYVKSKKGIFESLGPTGVKVYTIGELNPYSIGNLKYVATLGDKKEYYLEFNSLTEVQTLLTELNYKSVLYPENILTLLERHPEALTPSFTQTPFGISVLESDTEVSVKGYVSLTLKQIEEYLEVNITDWVEPELPILKISPRQARLALLNIGLLDDVEELVATSKVSSIYWEYALEINRYDETLLLLTKTLGLSEEDIDTLFADGAML